MYDFLKIFFFFKKNCLFKVNYLFNSVQKKPLCKKIHSLKQTLSVKHEFCFRFSFATNEQV